jgi:tetratricopeptide (TPR) repeat protein
MKVNKLQHVLAILVISIGFIGVFVLSNFITNSRPPLPEGYEDQDLALQSAKIKDFSLGFNGLLADWYWMRSLQYLGEKIEKSPDQNINIQNLRSLNPRLLYPLLDSATSLDPQYIAVYAYGAIVLPAIDDEQAIKITQKGIDNNPTQWRLYQHLGYIYWRMKNFEKAAETYDKGSKIAGAPPFMQLMVAQMKNQGGSRETSRKIYEQMLAEAQDTQTKKSAEIYLLKLDSDDELDAVRPVLKSIKEKIGQCVQNWNQIFPLLKNVKLPNGKDFRIDPANNLVDPSDTPYILDSKNCDIKLSPNSKLPKF